MDIAILDFRKPGFDVDEVNYQNRLAINKEILQAIADNPVVSIETKEATIEEIMEFLHKKHCTLWSTFSIHSIKGLARAATWFQAEISELNKYVSETRSEIN